MTTSTCHLCTNIHVFACFAGFLVCVACSFDPSGVPSTASDGAPAADALSLDGAVSDGAVPMDGATPPVDGGQVEQTLTFQAPGYSGTRDTYIWEGEPDDNFGSENELWWDLEFRGALDAHTLLRFENIFGTGADQIPVGSTIVSATLAMQVTDPGVADPGELHELLVDWGEYTATFENFGANPGAQVNEDYAPEVVAQLPFMMAPAELQVTSSVARWAIDPATNRGWIFVPRNTNGVEISPSEGASPPALTVVFISD